MEKYAEGKSNRTATVHTGFETCETEGKKQNKKRKVEHERLGKLVTSRTLVLRPHHRDRGQLVELSAICGMARTPHMTPARD